jgi:hypothetical protein
LPEPALLPEFAPPWDAGTWRRPLGRAVSAGIGLGALAAAIALGGAVTPTFWAGLLGPDAAFLVTLRRRDQPPPRGALPEDAVGLYNVLHDVEGPTLALLLAALTASQPLLVGGLGWLAHIGLDRALGFGLRRPDGHIH